MLSQNAPKYAPGGMSHDIVVNVCLGYIPVESTEWPYLNLTLAGERIWKHLIVLWQNKIVNFLLCQTK